MTKEKEANSYEPYTRCRDKSYFCNFKEELSLKDFIARFPEHEWFVLVLNGDEQCEIDKYPQETLVGIEVEKRCKCIKIYNPTAAVELFHEIYQKSIPVE